MNTETILRESRAKIIWGEPRQSVLEYMQANGLGDKEAMLYLDSLFRERADDIRKTGIKKIVIGSFWISLLIGYLAFSLFIGIIEYKLLAASIVSAMIGGWKIIEGLGYILKPSSESGDLSNLKE